MKLLLGIISHEKPESLIVFCNTKKSCEIVAKRLKMNGFESEFIIGDLPQKKRLAIMDKFKAGSIKCLVATDVAARGIDVNDLAMVINYDLPNEAENYVHRIGRTARAGKSGKAFTFCSEQDVYSLPPIERYIEKSIPSCVADESMFAEDKSAGVYIKLDSYHEDYNDKSEFGRRRAAEYNRKNGNSDRRRSSKKGSGRYSSRNEEAKKEYKRDRRVYIDEDKLASMSTEERMKIYREKYASFASGSSSNKQKISTKKQGVAKKNSSVQKNASGKKNYSSKSAESKKTPQKKSVFARIKSFFGKK